jgi:hypothetical protein
MTAVTAAASSRTAVGAGGRTGARGSAGLLIGPLPRELDRGLPVARSDSIVNVRLDRDELELASTVCAEGDVSRSELVTIERCRGWSR